MPEVLRNECRGEIQKGSAGHGLPHYARIYNAACNLNNTWYSGMYIHDPTTMRDHNGLSFAGSRVKRAWTCGMWYWLTCCLVLESVLLATRAASLFPYETHQLLPMGNEEAAQITLTTPFVFLGQNYTALTVSEHGMGL